MKSLVASLHRAALDDSRPVAPDLEQLIEAAAARLQAGEAVDLEELIASHHEYADQLRELLPAVELLVRMGHQTPEPACGPAATNGHAATSRTMGLHQECGRTVLKRRLTPCLASWCPRPDIPYENPAASVHQEQGRPGLSAG